MHPRGSDMSWQVRLGPLTSTSWTPDKYAYESTIHDPGLQYDMSGYDMSVISRGDESHESNNIYPG